MGGIACCPPNNVVMCQRLPVPRAQRPHRSGGSGVSGEVDESVLVASSKAPHCFPETHLLTAQPCSLGVVRPQLDQVQNQMNHFNSTVLSQDLKCYDMAILRLLLWDSSVSAPQRVTYGLVSPGGTNRGSRRLRPSVIGRFQLEFVTKGSF
jgi:hypothetical protein